MKSQKIALMALNMAARRWDFIAEFDTLEEAIKKERELCEEMPTKIFLPEYLDYMGLSITKRSEITECKYFSAETAKAFALYRLRNGEIFQYRYLTTSFWAFGIKFVNGGKALDTYINIADLDGAILVFTDTRPEAGDKLC